MREELEALKTLEVYGIASCVSVEEKNQARLTIETALKEYETLKTLHANQVETINALLEEDKTKEKKLKALEYIKDLFDFDFAIRFGNNQPMLRITNKLYEKLGKPFYYWEIPITQEKYDLLKEVLK